MIKRIGAIALTLGVLTVLFPTTPAAAQATSVSDEDDVAGSLDISQISVTTRYGANDDVTSYRFEVKTHDRWKCRYLNKEHDTKLKLKWHDRGDRATDLVGRFRCLKGELWLFMRSADGQQHFEPLLAKHPTRRLARVVVPEAAFQGGFKTWAKSEDAHHADCLEAACIDRAPDDGRM